MRDVTLDNFKFILIALVIVGHAIEPVIGRFEWVKEVYIFIYLFHMPMFAYISGAVSSRKIDDAVINSIVSKLVIPYVLLEIVYSIFDYFVFSRNSLSISPLVPYWILWYMFSLILWRILLPIFAQFKFPIVLSLLVGLGCGLNAYNYNLSFSRTFVFLPFFLIGHYKHSQFLGIMQRFKVSRIIGVTIIAVMFALTLTIECSSFNVGWLYGSKSYSSLGVGWEQGAFNRFCIYVLGFLLGMGFLAIVPKGHGFYTVYGKESLYIYVLHGFIMKGLLAVGFYKYINNEWKVVVLMLFSLILLPILSSRFSKIIANNMMNPLGGSSKNGFVKLVLVHKTMQADTRYSRH